MKRVSCSVRLALAALFASTACSRVAKERVAGTAAPFDPTYVELVSLREDQDASHRVPVRSQDGKTWYREVEPGANLSDLRLYESYAIELPTENEVARFGLVVSVQRRRQRLLSIWTHERLNMPIGIVLDGKLLAVETLRTPLGSHIMIQPFGTIEAAERVRAALRAGGDVRRIDVEQARMRIEDDRLAAEFEAQRIEEARNEPPADAFEIVSLRERPDCVHTQPIEDNTGAWWYRDPVPGFDLRQCESTSLGGLASGAYGFRAVLKKAHAAGFAQWCRERVGQPFGLATEGNLMLVERIPGELVDRFNRVTLVLNPARDVGLNDAILENNSETPSLEFEMRSEPVRAEVITVNAGYLQIVLLSATQDASHVNKVAGADGTIWFRPEAAAIDLSVFDFERAGIIASLAGEHRLCIPVSGEHREAFAQWVSEHAGATAGVVLNGRLTWIGQLDPDARYVIEIARFPDRQSAESERAAIVNGGHAPHPPR